MHHIITDGWSIAIFFREMTACYAAFVKGDATTFSELPIQYADYAQWQREYMNAHVLANKIQHWKDKLAGAQSVLELPLDYARPTGMGWHGATEEASFDASTLAVQTEKAVAQAENATLFMLALAAFQALLWRYTNQESVCGHAGCGSQ